MASSFFSFIFLILSTIFFQKFISINACKNASGRHVSIFIFGDSFFDSGNNNYINTTTLDKANFWPYGETFFKFPTGRFSDGRLIPDFIAEYAKVPLIPPYLQPRSHRLFYHGANFASAGAGALLETFKGSVIDLRMQLKHFQKLKGELRKKLGDVETKMRLSRATYLVSIGSNDYISPFLTNSTILSSYSQTQYVQMVIGNLSIVVKELYSGGGRKFGFLNLGDLGCLPGLRILNPQSKKGCFGEASKLAKMHNKALRKFLTKMEKELHEFRYSLYDFNHALRQMINHPYKYGFKEGKTACCGTGLYRGVFSCGGKRPVKEFQLCENPNEYVLWDSYHNTERVYKLMAAQMWSNKATKGTNSLKSLINCF